jgi:hypothetical protein
MLKGNDSLEAALNQTRNESASSFQELLRDSESSVNSQVEVDSMKVTGSVNRDRAALKFVAILKSEKKAPIKESKDTKSESERRKRQFAEHKRVFIQWRAGAAVINAEYHI